MLEPTTSKLPVKSDIDNVSSVFNFMVLSWM